MNIHFIGGAHEIGGSAAVLEIDNLRILIDCGLKMGSSAHTERLPDLARIQELGSLDAILITHAHADHIGALPLIHLAYPQTPIYTTEATQALMKVMLADSLKIMESRWQAEKEIPLYPEHAVLSTLARIKTLPLEQASPLCQDQLQVTFLLSGHVLGACSLTLDTSQGRIFWTGDYSIDAQRTVDPLTLPKIRPQVVITEATYGNRLHANRKAEETRLAQAVAEVIARKGKVLIPAFALGRAQEVLLVLIQEQKAGRIPPFPIFVDGMVRNICNLYALYPEYLGQRLKKQVLKHGNPFFYEGSTARAVDHKQRYSVPAGEPCCIVSSSGMLTGGPSQFYAAELASDPNNAIFITGYQDEESPGAKILALADQPQSVLRLADREITFNCQVSRYNLSAHADAGQITSLLAQLAPQRCYLVHGDDAARQALSQMLPSSIQVVLPRNGQAEEFAYTSTLKSSPAPAAQPRFTEAAQLRHYLLQQGAHKAYTSAELAELYPYQGPWEALGFQKEPHRPLYRLQPQAAPKPPSARVDHGPLQQARQAFQLIPEVLHLGWRAQGRQLLVSVAFPLAFASRRQTFIQDLEHQLKVSILVQGKDTLRSLSELVRKHLPLEAKLTKPPSLYPDQRVGLRLRFPDTLQDSIDHLVQLVSQETGYAIEIQRVEDAPPARQLLGDDGRMELNSAYRHIKETLSQAGLTVSRCGRKEEHIEIGLLAPWLLEPLAPLVSQLEQETGYPLRPSGVNHVAIEKLLLQTLPPAWPLAKSPSFFLERRTIGLSFQRTPDPPSFKALSDNFFTQVGLRLELLF